MNDTDFLRTLKHKKESHLAEIRRLQRLVESIDNLMRDYSNDKQGLAQQELPTISDPPMPDNGLAGLNLTEAIAYIMNTKPTYAWRGTEITKKLKASGYYSNNLGQKVSSRLVERIRRDTSRWKRIEPRGKYPTYQLKEEYIDDLA